jgi:protein-L-isoaspartate(D-aspartate) O-methyltransferase
MHGAEALVARRRRLRAMDEAPRKSLVAAMRREGTLTDAAVAHAFETVPRHRFIPGVPLLEAYADRAITIKGEAADALASISQPSMLARILELAAVHPGNRILEIGTGSGYNAALLAELAGTGGRVVTVDVEADLVEAARAVLADCGYSTVRADIGDGLDGFAPEAPFDRIIVSARATDIARAWWEQLNNGGRIVVPLDIGIGGEYAIGFARAGNELHSVGASHCLFVPLRGEHGAMPPKHVFTRSPESRYGTRPRTLQSIVAVRTQDASPGLLERADVVVAQPQTTFAITWKD